MGDVVKAFPQVDANWSIPNILQVTDLTKDFMDNKINSKCIYKRCHCDVAV